MGEPAFDEVAARAAHDLAGALSKVTAFAGILRAELPGELPEEAAQTLEHLCVAADEGRALVAAFHEWARAGTHLRPEEVDLAALLHELVARASAARPPAEVALDLERGLHVQADREALARALGHLLDNALRFVAPGSAPRVRIHGRPVGRIRVVCFDDAGIGIAPSDRSLALEPFTRLNPKSHYPGAGLGLATARRILVAHGGSLVLDDSPLGGLRARVELPA